jgi:hypothetical protein
MVNNDDGEYLFIKKNMVFVSIHKNDINIFDMMFTG